MTRIKRGTTACSIRKEKSPLTKNSIGFNSSLFRIGQQDYIKIFHYAYKSRYERKRQRQYLCLARMNARVRIFDWNYYSFIHLFRGNEFLLNRKILVQLLFFDPISFKGLICLFFKMDTFSVAFQITFPRIGEYHRYYRRTFNYKNVNLLQKHILVTGRIIPRTSIILTIKEHRTIAKSIHQSRRRGLLPFIWLEHLL